MSAARSDLCEVSPIAQRNASTRFDLPQPFGPTTPVKPGSIMKSVGSTNDLKPWRRRRVSFMDTISLLAGRESPCRDNTIEGNVGVWASRLRRLMAGDNGEAGAGGQPRQGLFPRLLRGLRAAGNAGSARAQESALQQRFDPLVEFLERGLAPDHLTVDEKGRRRVDLQDLVGELLVGGDLVEQCLVFEAILDRLLAEAGLLADPGQRFRGVLHHPIVLLPEQHVDDGEIFSRIVL